MKGRPILFSAPMVRAILAGTKTQTRRVAKGLALEWLSEGFTPEFVADYQNRLCPYGQPGDRLWVRETWALAFESAVIPHPEAVIYRADEGNADWGGRWKPSIHMPRWASRITLEIVSVRVERLQDISGTDCLAEGVGAPVGSELSYGSVTDAWNKREYARLWESINGPGSWDANPWVWVVEFKRVT